MGEFRGYEPSEKEMGINSNENSDGLMGKIYDKAEDFVKKHPWLTTAGVAFAMYKLNGDSILPVDEEGEETYSTIEYKQHEDVEYSSNLVSCTTTRDGFIGWVGDTEIVIDHGVRRKLHYYDLYSDYGECSLTTIASFDPLPAVGVFATFDGEIITKDRFEGQDYFEEGILLAGKITRKYETKNQVEFNDEGEIISDEVINN